MTMFAKHIKRHRAEDDAVLPIDDVTITPAVDAGEPIDETPIDPEGEVVEGEFVATDEGDETDKPDDAAEAATDDKTPKDGDESDTDTDEDEDEEEEEDESPEKDEEEASELETQLYQMMNAQVAIESYGASPGTIAVLQATGLLCGTALETIACEAFSDARPGSDETKMALESLGEKIKETAGKWSAKIMSVVSGIGSKIMGLLTPIWNKITSVSKKILSGAWDGVKAAGRTVKAHPIATVTAIILAITAAVGVIAFAGGNFPAVGSKLEALTSYQNRIVEMVKKIKWPFGKIDCSVVGNKLSVAVESVKGAAGAAKEAVVGKLGWTQSGVKMVTGQLDRAWTGLKTAVGTVGTRFTKLISGVKNVAKDGAEFYVAGTRGSNTGFSSRMAHGIEQGHSGKRIAAGAFLGGAMFYAVITGISVFLYKITKFIIVGGMRLVLASFRAVGSLFGGRAEPTAA